MSVDLASTLKTFVGDKTLTTSLLLEAASHLVDSLKELSLTDMEKNQLVFTALLAHVTPKPACVPLLSRLPLSSCLPLFSRLPFFKSRSAPEAATAPAPPTAAAPPESLAVRVPESS